MPITKKRKQSIYDFHGGICESCKKQFKISEINIHRITRKGSYKNHRNLKLLCKKCHRAYHQNEFNGK